MTKLLAVCCIAMVADFAIPTFAEEQQQPLRLTQTIPLEGVKGRLDHMGMDLEKKATVCGRRYQQYVGGCGSDRREGDQQSRRIQGRSGRAVPGR